MSSNLAEKRDPSDGQSNRKTWPNNKLDAELARRVHGTDLVENLAIKKKLLEALNLPGSGTAKTVIGSLKKKGIEVVSAIDDVPPNSVTGDSVGAMKVKSGPKAPRQKPKKEPKAQQKDALPKPIERTVGSVARAPLPTDGDLSAKLTTAEDKIDDLKWEIFTLEKRLKIARGKNEEWPWAEKEIRQLKEKLSHVKKAGVRTPHKKSVTEPPPKKRSETMSPEDKEMFLLALEIKKLDRRIDRTPDQNETLHSLTGKLYELKRKRAGLPPPPNKESGWKSKKRKRYAHRIDDPHDWLPENEQRNRVAQDDDPPKDVPPNVAPVRAVVSPAADTEKGAPSRVVGTKPRVFVGAQDNDLPGYDGTYLANELAKMDAPSEVQNIGEEKRGIEQRLEELTRLDRTPSHREEREVLEKKLTGLEKRQEKIAGQEAEKIVERSSVSPEQLQKDAVAHMESLSLEDRKTFLEGVANAGLFIQEKKSASFQSAFSFAKKLVPEDSVLSRFFSGYAGIYEKEKNAARAQQETVEKNFAQKAVGIGTGAGVLVKYGRVIIDAFGGTILATNPLAWVTLTSMALGRTSEAVKEARLSYDSVKEKTRVGDIDRAADEAWSLYEKARAGGEEVTAAALTKMYAHFLPEDVYARLSRMDFAGFGIAQTLAHKNILRTVERIKGEMIAIDEGGLSVEEKTIARERELMRYRAFFSDMDRIVGDMGMIGMFAYGARILEKGGKTTANIMALETLAEGATRLFQVASAFELGTLAEQVPENSAVPPSETNENAIARVKTQLHEILGSSHTVAKGDNAWNIIGAKVNALQEQGFMPTLNEAQNTRLLKNLEIKLTGMSPDELRAFGFSSGNIGDIRPGDVINLSPILENDVTLPAAIEDATNLTAAQEESILASNEARREWAREHSGQPFPEAESGRAGADRQPEEIATTNKNTAPSVVSEIFSSTPASSGDTVHEQISDADFERAIAERTRAGVEEVINERFRRSGLFGFGSTPGTESDEWLYMKDMPVTRVLGRIVPGASEEEIANMGKLIEEVTLEANIGGPNEGETVLQFISRGMKKMVRARTIN